jgi:hypothetical protein
MDINLTNYGWSGLNSCSISSGTLVFPETGFVVNNNTMMNATHLPAVEAEFTYKTVDSGVILWYNTIGYIIYKLSPNSLSLVRIYDNKEIVLRNSAFSDLGITAPIADEIFTLRAEMDRTNIKCYYNGTLVFNIEQNAFSEGVFGIYGTNGTVCNSFKAESSAIAGWERSWKTDQTGCITIVASNGLQVIHIDKGVSSDSAGIHTYINTVAGEDYTASVNYTGSVAVNVAEGGTTIASATGYSEAGDTISLLFTPTGSSVDVSINADGESLVISEPQVEQKSFRTSYTPTAREAGSLSMPAQKINRYDGALSMWVSPRHAYTDGTLPIFYYNDTFKMEYTGGAFVFTYGDVTVSSSKAITAGSNYHIICTWSNGVGININVFDGTTDVLNSLAIAEKTISLSSSIYIGSTPTSSGNLIADTLVVYAGSTTVDNMKAFRAEPISKNDNRIVINSEFTNNTLVFSNNRIIVPNGKPLTPIIVEDEDGTIYERVYFTDNGSYTVYNKKKFTYTGTNVFELDYSDLISVRAYSDEAIYSNISTSGAVVTVGDLPLNSETLEEITIEYTPRNVFCVDYNDEANGREITFSNVSGKKITVTYENELGAELKLVTTVEANPFKSVNNNGFVYVTQTPVLATTLDVMVTPNALFADGHQVATITIDCIGRNNVPTSNVSLNVVLANGNKYGTIEKYTSDEEADWLAAFEAEKALNGEAAATAKYGNFVTDEHMSGRFVYRFRVNNITSGGSFIEKIIVTDLKSGMGTEVPIRIVSK